MVAQIFEPFSGGHHTKYVSFILPALVRLREAGRIARIVLTTTDRHRKSPYFANSLARYASNVEFDIVPAGDIYDAGHKVTGMLLESLRRHRPDYLVSTSADNGALTLALRRFLGSEFRPGLASVGVMHYGSYGASSDVRARLRDGVHRFSRRFSPWSRIAIVNPLLYDFLKRPGSRNSERIELLPDPVEVRAPVPKARARQSLGLPPGGTYAAAVGQSNATKAIPELLAAFDAARLAGDERLLLAGRVHPPYRELIERDYAHLLERRRLVLVDRYLSPDELHFATCAADVIAVADTTGKLSSTLLAAVAAERPVIADAGGYTGMILRRFGVGYAADLRDKSSFAAAFERAMQTAADFELPAVTRRLVQFHAPQNFVDTLLAPLYERLGLAANDGLRWEEL